MQIFIKNMVCKRCVAAVERVFHEMNIDVVRIELGEVEIRKELSSVQLINLDNKLQNLGFEILEDSAKKLIEQIKKTLLLEINKLDIAEDFLLSTFLCEHFSKDYSALSRLFSQHENITLEHYFILQKIEKAKELLLYNELFLTEISHKLGYKSVQHLSAQFKSATGFTPTAFKKLKAKNRIPLDEI